LDHLDAQGLSKDTLVVYVADNGWIQNPDGPRFAPKSKRTSYDGGVRTPILLRQPGRIVPRRDDTPVSGIDLAPTILKACGAPVPEGLPGLDLRDAEAVKARPAVFGATFLHTAVDLDVPSKNLEQRWVVAGAWKLIAPVAGDPELYDLSADPHETKNLAAGQADRVAGLRKTLDGWWTP
ncbi:MAG TPA: sulfatase/phosphatase domain-containing protein, partial [Planctomycetota bacterium]|nr:sulfatase/phosphatase domain-containing protein [Planctomycetota bacterium]